MLYTLSKRVVPAILEQWQPLFTQQDVLLLTENGVLNSITNTAVATALLALPVGKIYALQQDIIARGVSSYISISIHVIDDKQWVALTEQYYPQLILS